ncbi:MAG: restriction endonuclease [Candidatus Raymondbacteria bacterium RifOxyA12_full_50_37]|uniref:Restriction endonuclease n=1 Tax=Candidatus Raymondbacteria bacterium RIFOXYD12_FULL_49_13 TaxID=1817890 RepID=A0A1F7FG51_UNCRA|nr:MAG: restriction endonuclease [Candidatus Raymondbacteria bacterium RifOxyA12_full_50_37]OGJ94248.1 MAG: restriction endonuclease [Candidatus Raymondbacteria bacterium RIFOXYA2_FULL_49_16]OGJ94390.1 MAG: restriction endonuclease [Candidatus Raymondbacteria bacterium RifOxyB12_full_50_8]OGJ94767.1 MAG: restriction endonuclease [Candidatus Raymondbacteria bacterium RifOxyC12_full_50_8]OGJ99078.1 MAG: restriction endonuclease [Candidatus Raymondbacteria bacterium RIFOXYC2_FULL_50_21]OGK05446.1
MFNINDLQDKLKKAIAFYWQTRAAQGKKQKEQGASDQGARSAVTGGAQMDGIIHLLSDIILEAGIPKANIYSNHSLQLPGFFRPTKEWDLLVVKNGQRLLALEAKSQVGPSFGNNFNNRTEEAMGSALDLWTAYREGAFNATIKPWLGYFFMLEDCERSNSLVKVQEPHFKVFPEFGGASYAKRYELFCRKLVRERHYSVSSFILSSKTNGINGEFAEPASDLSFEMFVRSMIGQLTAFGEA